MSSFDLCSHQGIKVTHNGVYKITHRETERQTERERERERELKDL